ncbi:MAG: DUF4336 domain-containing protein [Betaproteobacteria bacterium]|nr:DUF4336 domain-containing protein [Betaproteobacteria bacterium]
MLHRLADDLWHITHGFKAGGISLTSRMTVVRLPDNKLWLHSPIPISDALRKEIDAIGTVAHIVAPSKTHHLFLPSSLAAFPKANLYGAPGLRAKRPDLVSMRELPADEVAPWAPALQHIVVEGIPFGNETVWFHVPSATLIVTDFFQWWQGDLPWTARLYATLTGVRSGLAVPRTVRALARDREAVRSSAARLQRWPFVRVVMAHNAVLEVESKAQVATALRLWA